MHLFRRFSNTVNGLFVIKRQVKYTSLIYLCNIPTNKENTSKLNHDHQLCCKTNQYFKSSLNHSIKCNLCMSNSVLLCGKSAISEKIGSISNAVNYSTLNKTKENCRSPENVKEIETKPHDTDKQNLVQRENIWTWPNLLTMSRIVATPVLGYLVLQQSFPLACGLFIAAGVTDLLDGYIARRFPSQTSAFGSFLDPLADKFLVSVLYVSLTVAHVIPVPLTVLVVSRDVLLICAAFYVRFISLPPPRTLTTFFNATHVSAQLKPLLISKMNTFLQLLLVAVSLAAPVFNYLDHTLLQALWWTTAGTTVASGVGYMFAKDTFKILQNAKYKKT